MPDIPGAVAREPWDKNGERPSLLDFQAVRGRKFSASIEAATQNLSSPDAAFTDDDIGNLVMIPTAGASGTYLTTTIQSVTDGSNAVVALAAGVTVSAVISAVGPDSKDAFNAAFAWMQDSTFAANNTDTSGIGAGILQGGIVDIPFGVYLVSGTVTINPHARMIGSARSLTEVWNTSDDFTFEYLSEVGTAQWGFHCGFRMENVTIFAKNGVKINREFADLDTQPGTIGTDYDYQAFILGMIFKQVLIVGEYNEALDPNYDTDVAPTLAELRGFGVGLHMNKVFDSDIKGCNFKRHGIGLLMTGCDINEIATTRFNRNARHNHQVLVEFRSTGSENTLYNNDILVNHRVGAIYLDRAAATNILHNFFECSTDAATYLITFKDIYTKIVANQFNNPGKFILPWADFDTRWGTELLGNSWTPSTPTVAPIVVRSNHTSDVFREQIICDNNSAYFPVPDYPGVRVRPYERYLFSYNNHRGTRDGRETNYLEGYITGQATAGFPWAQNSAGKWGINTGDTPGSLSWIAKIKNPADHKFLVSYSAMKTGDTGGIATFYMEDIGVVTVDPGTDTFTLPIAHGLSNDDRVAFRNTTEMFGGILGLTAYWVISATVNTFQVSVSQGGAAVDVTSTGAGDVYAQNWNSLVSVGQPFTETTEPTAFQHSLRIPSHRRGDGWFQIFVDADVFLDSITLQPTDAEYVTSEPAVQDNFQSGDKFWNKDLAGVEPMHWIYTNDDEMRPGFRLGNCTKLDFISATPVTLTADDGIISVDTNVGDFTLNLPPQTSGKWFLVQNRSGPNNVIVAADGSDLIDGAATFTLGSNVSPYHQTALIMGLGGINWSAVKLGEQLDRVILGNSPDHIYIDAVTVPPEGTLARPPGSIASDSVAGALWYKLTGNGDTGWGPISAGIWSFIDSDTITTPYRVHLTDSTNVRPMELKIVPNLNASQSTVRPLDVAGFTVDELGKAHAKALGVGYTQPATNGHAHVQTYMGVGRTGPASGEILGVSGKTWFGGDVEYPAEPSNRPLILDGNNIAQGTKVNLGDPNHVQHLGVTGYYTRVAANDSLEAVSASAVWDAILAAVGAAGIRAAISASSDVHNHTGTANISISGTTGTTEGHSHSFSGSDSDPFTTSGPIG